MSEELKQLEELLANDRKIIEENYKEIERLNNNMNKVIADMEDVRDKNNYYDDHTVDNSVLTYWIDLLKGSDKE